MIWEKEGEKAIKEIEKWKTYGLYIFCKRRQRTKTGVKKKAKATVIKDWVMEGKIKSEQCQSIQSWDVKEERWVKRQQRMSSPPPSVWVLSQGTLKRTENTDLYQKLTSFSTTRQPVVILPGKYTGANTRKTVLYFKLNIMIWRWNKDLH